MLLMSGIASTVAKRVAASYFASKRLQAPQRPAPGIGGTPIYNEYGQPEFRVWTGEGVNLMALAQEIDCRQNQGNQKGKYQNLTFWMR